MTGEHLSPDIQELVRLLYEHRVRYLLVGGEAVIHHGYPRLTGDVDFFYEQTPANARRLFAALSAFWGGTVPAVADAEELLARDVIVQFGRPPNRVDFISSLGTVPFSRAWRRRISETLHADFGEVPLPIIGLEDLLQSKRDAGRHKDLDDIDHLKPMAARSPVRGGRKAPARVRKKRKKR